MGLFDVPSEPHPPSIRPWLDLLWPDDINGPLSMFATSPDGQKRATPWADTLDRVEAVIADASTEANVWLSVATQIGQTDGRARADNARAIPGLWVDIDIAGVAHAADNLPADEDEALELAHALGPPPTAVVHSGNGLQCWWLFHSPAGLIGPDGDDTRRLVEGWARTWKRISTERDVTVDPVFDLARILRVPGTLNWKTSPPKLVTLVHADGPRYSVDDIDGWLDPEVPADPRPVPSAVGDLPREGSPSDEFNRRFTAADVLAERGWTLVRTEASCEHWRHPAATNDQSATVYYDDGHVTLWTTSIPGIEDRRPMDPWGLFVRLDHGGDFRAASRHAIESGLVPRREAATPLHTLNASAGSVPSESAEPVEGVESGPLSAFDLIRRDTLVGAEVADIPEAEPMVDGWLDRGMVAELVAPHSSGKTWVALGLAWSVATGRPWLGQTISSPGPVFYIAAEGGYTIGQRSHGWLAHHGLEFLPDEFRLLPRPVNLLDVEWATALFQVCEMLEPHLVVFDTLNRSMAGGDENSSEHMGTVFEWMDRIRRGSGATCLALHHTPLGEKGRGRGHSSFEDNADVVLGVEAVDGGFSISSLKQKARENPSRLAARLDTSGEHPVFVEADGAPVVSEPDGGKWRGRVRGEFYAAVHHWKRSNRVWRQPLTPEAWIERAAVQPRHGKAVWAELADERIFVQVEDGWIPNPERWPED